MFENTNNDVFLNVKLHILLHVLLKCIIFTGLFEELLSNIGQIQYGPGSGVT